MVGSLLLLLVLLAGLGRWEGLLLLGWLGSGAMVLRPSGERLAVRIACGFRRPTADQVALLSPVWAAALQRAGTSAGDVDLYVRHRDEPNAYAAGGRSVAVTSGVLHAFLARRLGEEQMTALLVHELGHRATKATQLGLMAAWLAAPWRLTARRMTGIAMTLTGARRQPRLLLAVVAAAEVIVAVLQAVAQHQWMVAFLIGAIATAAVLCPLIDAAVSRRGEYAADRFAAQHGVGPDLADALRALDHRASCRRGPMARLLASHPTTSCRIEALVAYSRKPRVVTVSRIALTGSRACAHPRRRQGRTSSLRSGRSALTPSTGRRATITPRATPKNARFRLTSESGPQARRHFLLVLPRLRRRGHTLDIRPILEESRVVSERNLMSFTRCTVLGHKWQKKRYPDAPPDDEESVYAQCRRCGKQREIEPAGIGAFKYTVGGQF